MLLNVFSPLVSISQFFLRLPFQQLRSWIFDYAERSEALLLLSLQENPSSLSSSWPYILNRVMERGATAQLLVKWRELSNSWPCWFRVGMCCLLNPWEGSAWKVPPCAWEWRGRAVGDCRVSGAAGWKAVAPLDKHSISSVVFTNYEPISTNVTAATELWGLDITNKQDGILLICAWSVTHSVPA